MWLREHKHVRNRLTRTLQWTELRTIHLCGVGYDGFHFTAPRGETRLPTQSYAVTTLPLFFYLWFWRKCPSHPPEVSFAQAPWVVSIPSRANSDSLESVCCSAALFSTFTSLVVSLPASNGWSNLQAQMLQGSTQYRVGNRINLSFTPTYSQTYGWLHKIILFFPQNSKETAIIITKPYRDYVGCTTL